MKHKLRLKKIFAFTPATTIIFGFLAIILIGTFFLCLPISNTNGQWFSFVDSLFTSTSAVCVTGLACVDVAMEFTLFGQIVVLMLIQVGGLGFVTITSLIFMLLRKKINYSTRLTIQESFNKDNTQGVVKMVKCIVLVTFGVELLGCLVLLPSMVKFAGSFWNGLFKALFLSVSAFCNAGIDPLGTTTPAFSSLQFFQSNAFVLIPVMLLIVVGGIGFIVLFDIFGRKKENKKLSMHSKVVLIVTFLLITLGALMFGICEWNNPQTIGNLSVGGKIMNCLFQSITPRTAGFSTFDQAGLTSVSAHLTNFLMVVGGSPTSIAGGIKTTTLFILILLLIKPINKTGNITIMQKNISTKIINKTIKLLLMYVSIVAVSALSLYFIEGMNFNDIIFECISALSTVGLSRGLTPLLCAGSKLIVTLLMFVGRVGMLTLPLAFKHGGIADDIQYADSKIVVG